MFKGFWILTSITMKVFEFLMSYRILLPIFPSLPTKPSKYLFDSLSGAKRNEWSMQWLRVNKENWILFSKGDPVHQVPSCTCVSSQNGNGAYEISETCQDQSSNCWQSTVLYAWMPVQTSSRLLNPIYENPSKKSTTFFYSLDAVPFISNTESKCTSNVSF